METMQSRGFSIDSCCAKKADENLNCSRRSTKIEMGMDLVVTNPFSVVDDAVLYLQ